ncbi:TIR domain-containing protein [Acetobacterium paludosum]|uniref:TIR domain-containing protein n=1 Tax=Acetobacterium paludosum TaxID=52693 RepID=A0A923HSN4_9FIRM|nr:TIR domain-containing protein [Acetobacterium paludosum]MBC3887611.1 TIR domain-containing protein [Acetobacterium paludosum]
MKVFISWSGKLSCEVAKVLKEWIPYVIQDIVPYFSSKDIDKGARWSTDIAEELESADFGILCVTKDNLKAPWLNFEAGALSKAMDKSFVCPFLFDLKASDISNSPILQFQMTTVDQEDIFKLFKSMNDCLSEKKLGEEHLKKAFDLSWSQIDEALKKIIITPTEVTTNIENQEYSTTKQNIILEEMLDLLRTQQVILSNPEKILPKSYLNSINNDRGSNAKSRRNKNMIWSCMNDLEIEIRELSDFYNIYRKVDNSMEIDNKHSNRLESVKSTFERLSLLMDDLLMIKD